MNISIKDYSEIIVAISLIAPIVIGLIIWIRGLCYKLYHIYNIVNKEFCTNGGTSMRDAINRIEHNQKILASLQHHMYTYWDFSVETPIFICDSFGGCLWANDAYKSITGRDIEDILDYNWESIIHQDDRERVRQEWYNACGSGHSFDLTYRIIDKNNQVQNVKCKAFGNYSTGYIGFLVKIQQTEEVSV